MRKFHVIFERMTNPHRVVYRMITNIYRRMKKKKPWIVTTHRVHMI